MATKTKNPYNVRKSRGTKITEEVARILRNADREAMNRGYTVLGSLFAKVPGFDIYFATAYVHNPDGLPPFGVIKVCILNNGEVRAAVMGTGHGEQGQERFDVK